MIIVPKTGPSAVNSPSTAPAIASPGGLSEQAKAARARAIAAFSGNQPSAVQNQSQVSPEEMVGVKASLAQIPESGPDNTSETLAATSPNPPAETTEEQPLSPQYAILARKEKALRAEMSKLNVERAAFKAEREALKANAPAPTPTFDESKYIAKDRLFNDPVSVFEENGLTGEELANKILNHKQVDPQVTTYIQKLEAKLAKLEASQDETRKTIESGQTAAYEQAVTAIRYEAEELVNTDPEFATIKQTGQAEEIVNLIKDVHEKGLEGKYRKGTLLTVEAAARLVEDELVNQWVEQYDKLSQLDKIKKRLSRGQTQVAKPGTPSQGSQAQPTSATSPQTKTLTNSMATGSKLSARERAIAVFNGTIKN